MQDTSDHPKESEPITEVDILPNDSTYNTLLRSASPTLPMPTNGQYSQLKPVFQQAINQTSQDYSEIYSTVDNWNNVLKSLEYRTLLQHSCTQYY